MFDAMKILIMDTVMNVFISTKGERKVSTLGREAIHFHRETNNAYDRFAVAGGISLLEKLPLSTTGSVSGCIRMFCEIILR